MRVTTKIVSAISALVLAVSLVGFVGSPAQAAKPKHSLTASPGTSGSGKTFISGKAETLPKKFVKIERKTKGGSWKTYKKADTDAKGKYKAFVSGPSKSCFRVIAPGNKKYRTAKVFVGCLA